MTITNKIKLDKKNPIPLYNQVQKILVEQFTNNPEYMFGEPLPSERNLVRIFGVHRTTIKRAINGLKKKKVLITKHGKGTYFRKNVMSLLKSPVDFNKVEAQNYESNNVRLDREIILKIKHRENVEEIKQYTYLFEMFKQKHPYVNLSIETTDDYYTELFYLIQHNILPDILYIGADYIPVFAQKGLIIPLDDFIKNDNEIFRFYPQVLDQIKFKNKIWFLPKSFSSTVLFYNKELFNKEQIAYPDENWTWETYLETAKKLTKEDNSQYGSMCFEDFNQLAHIIWSNGADITTDDARKITITNKDVIESIQFAIDLTKKHKVTPLPYNPENIDDKKIAMFISGAWTTFRLLKQKDIKWNIAPIPKGKNCRVSRIRVGGYAISSKCRYHEIALELIKLICSPIGIEIFAKNKNDMPTIKNRNLENLFLNNNQNINMKIFYEMLKYSYNFAMNGGFLPYISKYFMDMIKVCFLNNDKKIKDILSVGQSYLQLGLNNFFKEVIDKNDEMRG